MDLPVIPNDEEIYLYFTHVLEKLENEISNYEENEIFIRNVLDQTEGQELQLSCKYVSSHCIELLLDKIYNVDIVMRFMKAFSQNFEVACGNCFASHVTETLLYHGTKYMQNWSLDIATSEKDSKFSEKAKNIVYVISWIHSLGEFCLKNLQICFEDAYGCYVLKGTIQALGGYFISENNKRNKKFKEQKTKTETYGNECDFNLKEDIVISVIPKFFVSILKEIANSVVRLENIRDYVLQPETAPVIQILLYVLKRRLPNRCRKLIALLLSNLFNSKVDKGIPAALLHKNCSYVVEKIFDSATVNQQLELWQIQIEPFLESLILHPIANFVIQRMFDVVNDKHLFELMCESVFKFFNAIYESSHYGLLVSMATTCDRLKVYQAQYMINLMKCFDCLESEEKQLQLVPFLLALKRNEDFTKKSISSISDITIVLQGSLLVQAVLNFQKPLKVVKSILHMKSEDLAFLASHNQGCHVLLRFMSSKTVGEKNKDKFMQTLRPTLANLACHQNGNLTLSRIWTLMTIKQKSFVAEELLKNNHLLEQNRQGFGISKKFGLFYYKCKKDEWKTFQQNLTKKRKYLDDN